MRLVLASASPRRAELLRAAGFEFDIRAADVDERAHDREAPAALVRRLAAEKSAAAMAAVCAAEAAVVAGGCAAGDGPGRHGASGIVVLGADTVVVVDGDILGKPRDDADAATMLRRLSGRRHDVLTGVSVRTLTDEADLVETTAVEFSPLSAAEIAWYVASGEGRDKAGAYAIQGLAARFIPRIDGSYSNVVGLPLAAVARLLTTIASAT